MKINHQYNRYNRLKSLSEKNNGAYSRYSCAPHISFTSDPIKLVTKTSTIYSKIDKIAQSVDSVLGQNGYLLDKIQKAGLKIENQKVEIKNEKLLTAFINTIKYPITDMPFEFLDWVCKALKKSKKISKPVNALLNLNFIQKQLHRIDAKKNCELVSKILEQFSENDKFYPGNTDKLAQDFLQKSTGKITKIAKNYASRDERTLNRIATGLIGAYFSSKDMFNISMLEKDDKRSAKKAGKDRWEQESTRVLVSAGLTFVTLGIFDKFTKGNYILSSLIVAGSTLFAEVFSRLRKHKSLIPLTPERAAKIAQKQDSKKKPADKKTVFDKNTIKKLNSNSKLNLYKDFTYIKEDDINTNTTTTPKGTHDGHLGLKIAGSFIVCSLIYLISHKAKGEYAQKLARQALLNERGSEITNYLNGNITKLSDDLLEKINTVTKKNDGAFKEFADKLTKRDAEIRIKYLEGQVQKLMSCENAQEVIPILSKYQQEIEVLKSKNIARYSQKVQKTFVAALYEGVTKIFKTLYTILSSPGKLITYLQEKHFEESEKIFEDVEKLLNNQDEARLLKSYKKQLAELNTIFKTYDGKANGNKKIIKTLNTRTRNFEKSAETSELANFSRTLVTLIASYFYVNDFRNTVLIESGGKNTQRAREVMNDSIGFKLCNFFFNGTLMNLFNSVFKTALNGSLFGATLIAAATEISNEFLIRQTISRPMKKLDSREEIIEFERSKANRKGFAGAWTRLFKKATGQKSLIEKYESSQNKK